MSRGGRAGLLLLTLLPLLTAQIEKVRQAVAYRTSEHIRIDGVLSEKVWRDAAPIGNFVQQEPQPGAPPSEVTEVRIAYNEAALFVAVHCRDSQKDQLRATQVQRDGSLLFDDYI
jgi:hypothetical protein